jgi:hypothetical protein
VLDQTEDEIDQLSKDPTNKYIYVELYSPDPHYSRRMAPKLENPAKFSQEMDTYRRVVQQLIGAMYQESGRQVPAKVLEWRSRSSFIPQEAKTVSPN